MASMQASLANLQPKQQQRAARLINHNFIQKLLRDLPDPWPPTTSQEMSAVVQDYLQEQQAVNQ